MGRRSTTVVIDDPKSRDHGKQFRVTEMAADVAERWAYRVLLAFANAGARLPDGVLDAGMAGIQATFPGLALQGLRSLAGLRYEDAEPILNAMLGCVSFVPSQGQGVTFSLDSPSGMSQVEEVSTLLKLRYEVLQVHVGFSLADALSASKESTPAAA